MPGVEREGSRVCGRAARSWELDWEATLLQPSPPLWGLTPSSHSSLLVRLLGDRLLSPLFQE